MADVQLTRLHHDHPVAGPFGAVQRTTRRNRSLKDDEEVLQTLEAAGIDRNRVLGVNRSKVDYALEVTELSEMRSCPHHYRAVDFSNSNLDGCLLLDQIAEFLDDDLSIDHPFFAPVNRFFFC